MRGDIPNRSLRRDAALALIMLLIAGMGLATPATQAGGVVRVGSKLIPEQQILGEMYALLLENAGIRVERRFSIGPTEVIHGALLRGAVDVYPEYTGTALLDVLNLPADADALRAFQTLESAYRTRFRAVWLAPANTNNTQAVAMTVSRASDLRIVTLSDFVARARELSAAGRPLVLAGPPEFASRNDGLAGIKRVYGDFDVTFRPVAAAGRYQLLNTGDVDAVVAFGTDGELDGFELATLYDDKRMFPVYQVAPVVRQDVLDRQPAIRDALNALAPHLNDAVLREMNFQATQQGVPTATLARNFLARTGLIPGQAVQTPVNYVGTYRVASFVRPGQLDGQATLSLHADGTAAVTWVSLLSDTLPALTGSGVWTAQGQTVSLSITRGATRTLASSVGVSLTFDSRFITSVDVTNNPLGAAQYAYFLSAGTDGQVISDLHARMAAISWLNYVDPGPDSLAFDESTRQAVVRFQQAQGMLPTGIVDVATWRALASPAPPQPTPQAAGFVRPRRAQGPRNARPATLTGTRSGARGRAQACRPNVVFSGAVNLRQEPGLQSNVLAVIPAGTTLPAAAALPDQSWYQVDFYGTLGWVSATVVDVACDDALPISAERPPQAADRVIYLSFDDGPHPIWTPQLMEVLQANGASAVFFQIGQQVTPYADVVRQQVAAGMEIGNHTWSHPSLSGIGQDEFTSQIQRTQNAQAALGAYAGAGVRCLRPPYGATDANTAGWSSQLGYRMVLWTVDPQDWAHPGAQQIAASILSYVRNGSIVLSHDGGGNRSQTIDAYSLVLPQLAAQGWRFARLGCA